MHTLSNAVHREDIFRRIRALTPDSRRRWGRMSVGQMLCHLADSYELVVNATGADDASNWFGRTVMKFVALKLPLRWPHGVPTSPAADPMRDGTQPREFEADRWRLVTSINTFVAHQGERWAPHPIFGEMTDEEWMRWGYRHADHHLRQFRT